MHSPATVHWVHLGIPAFYHSHISGNEAASFLLKMGPADVPWGLLVHAACGRLTGPHCIQQVLYTAGCVWVTVAARSLDYWCIVKLLGIILLALPQCTAGATSMRQVNECVHSTVHVFNWLVDRLTQKMMLQWRHSCCWRQSEQNLSSQGSVCNSRWKWPVVQCNVP